MEGCHVKYDENFYFLNTNEQTIEETIIKHNAVSKYYVAVYDNQLVKGVYKSHD